MAHYEIDNDKPLPGKRGKNPKYPFAQLEVGQSFTARAEPPSRLRTASLYWHRKLGWKFTVRKLEGGLTGATVWRTE